MKIDTDALKKQVILHLPYLLFLLVFAKLGEAVRLAPGADASQKLLGLSEGFSMAFQSMWPGAALDWLVGLCGAVQIEPSSHREDSARIKEMLTSTTRTITEISEMCGFSSLSYFGKVFRQHTGVTPVQYRSGL